MFGVLSVWRFAWGLFGTGFLCLMSLLVQDVCVRARRVLVSGSAVGRSLHDCPAT